MEEKEQSKVLELRSRYLGEEIAKELVSPTPREIVKERPIRGGGVVEYVPGPHFIRRLNDCFGFLWTYEVPEAFEKDGQIVGRGRLTVHIPIPKRKTVKKYIENGREIVEESTEFDILGVAKEQFGSSEIKKYSKTEYVRDKKGYNLKDDKGQPLVRHKAGDVIDLGDDYKGMGTDAMKKCATQLGIFLDVYEAREEEGEGVTKAQLDVFYWRAEEAGMSEEEARKWGEEQVGKPFSQWDPLDAMGLIPLLIDMKKKEG